MKVMGFNVLCLVDIEIIELLFESLNLQIL